MKKLLVLFPDNERANIDSGYVACMHDKGTIVTGDPRANDVREADQIDPGSGASDDPRVDPTPDGRQSDTTTDASVSDTAAP